MITFWIILQLQNFVSTFFPNELPPDNVDTSSNSERWRMARRKHYNFYCDDFKATAVALTEIPGVVEMHAVEVLDIPEVMLYRWQMEVCLG